MPSVKDLAANFQRKMSNRVVMTGHGSFRATDAKILVPRGKVIHFYVPHGSPLSNAVGMAVEGFDAGTPPAPVETIKGGQLVYNYILSYPSDLTLNGNKKNAKFDWISIAKPGQAVALSVLLKDSRCDTATEIHWAACRSRADWLAPNSHDAGYVQGRVAFTK
jgi:hypothetical protein